MRISTRTGALAVPLLALVLAAGCGAQDNQNDGIASLNGGKNSNSAKPSDSDVPSDPQQRALKYAKCMRDHGVDMPDPKPSDDGGRMAMPALPADKMDSVNKAFDACKKYSPVNDVDPNDPKVKDQQLKMNKCMREHGIDVSDPGADGKGSAITINGPEQEKAMKDCHKQVYGK